MKKEITCPNCGAKLEVEDYEKSLRCPYCSSLIENTKHDPNVLDPETIERYKREDEETTRRFHKRMEELRKDQIKLEEEHKKKTTKYFISLIIMVALFYLISFIINR